MSDNIRGSKIERTCRCGEKFMARAADVKRGWGKFCSKSCKAKVQEKRTGQHAAYHGRQNNYRGSGVDRETYVEHQREYGGEPQFDRHGFYEGCVSPHGSDGHDCNKD